MNIAQLKYSINDSITLKGKLLDNAEILNTCSAITELLIEVFHNENQLLLCGNGGSAADTLHLAAEFSGRYYKNRRALPAEALSVNMAAITAISNDYGFDQVYARMLEAKGKKGDVLWVFSTSGSSPNILNVAKKAKEQSIKVVAFTGEKSTALDDLCDLIVKIPSLDTPRIQECHLLLGHIICELVEKKMFNE